MSKPNNDIKFIPLGYNVRDQLLARLNVWPFISLADPEIEEERIQYYNDITCTFFTEIYGEDKPINREFISIDYLGQPPFTLYSNNEHEYGIRYRNLYTYVLACGFYVAPYDWIYSEKLILDGRIYLFDKKRKTCDDWDFEDWKSYQLWDKERAAQEKSEQLDAMLMGHNKSKGQKLSTFSLNKHRTTFAKHNFRPQKKGR